MTDFESIYRQYYAVMYRVAKVMLHDEQESKDVVSDVFLRVLSQNQPDIYDKAEGYFISAVRNRCLDVIAHKSVRERVEKLLLHDLTSNKTSAKRCDDRLERILQFVETQLSPLSRQIFSLRFLHDMSYDEVAKSVGVSRVTVYNHLSMSLQKIREFFKTETENQ